MNTLSQQQRIRLELALGTAQARHGLGRREERLARLGITDAPFGYVDGMSLYEYVGSNPANRADPLGLATTQPTTQPSGTATVDLTVNTGSNNKEQPWIGATWTIYRGAPNDGGNPGLVRIGLPKVEARTDGCHVMLSASIKMQIELRSVKGKELIQNIGGKRVLTEFGRQVYGHEQLHVKNCVTSLRTLVDDIARSIPDGVNEADAKRRAAEAKKLMYKALDAWRKARLAGTLPDITHGGPGQPVSGVGNDPEGEPGPWVP